jgi:flagellar biosynthesis protein FliR
MTSASVDLSELLHGQLFALLLISTRFGAALMLFPGFGESFISARTRAILTVLVSFAALPLLQPLLPKEPASFSIFVAMVGGELLFGLFLGTFTRILMSALETAGTIIGIQTSLSSASVFNPAMATQGSLPGAYLSMLALVILFMTDLHHMLLRGMFDSYALYTPGQPFPGADMGESIVRLVGHSFAIGVRMSAPFLIIGLLMSTGLGLMARLVPQMQVFFLAMPLQIGLGLFMFAVALSAMLMFWLQGFTDSFSSLLKGL